MITVNVSINAESVMTRSARRGKKIADGVFEYFVDDGRTVTHYRKDGAAKLAQLLLDGIKNIDEMI